MPSKSKKQKRFMAAAAHNPKFAKKAGIKQSVAKDFHAADKRKGYARGGAATTGFRVPGGDGPRASRGALGAIGSPARIGGLGGASGTFGGFASRSVRPRGGALSGSPLEGPGGASNLRPRPGRGVNPLLATAGIPYHEATDRLARLRGKIGVR
jgi:hypothetical protein